MVRRFLRSPVSAAVMVMMLLAGLLSGAAGAAEGDTVYTGCRKIGGEIIKVWSSDEEPRVCRPWQTVVTWSQTGPSGLPGAQGLPGEVGPEGPAGPPGVGFREDCTVNNVAVWNTISGEWECSDALATLQAQVAGLQAQLTDHLEVNLGTVSGYIWADTGAVAPGYCAIPPAGTVTGAFDGQVTSATCTDSAGTGPYAYAEPPSAYGELTITVDVNLLNAAGDIVDSTTVDGSTWPLGSYSFTTVEPHLEYMVEFVPPIGWTFTTLGGDMNVDQVTGRSPLFYMPLSGNLTDVGVAGFRPTA